MCVCVSHSAASNSLRTIGLQPARLLCPWDSPGKNTGVCCHSLLQGIFLTQGLNPGLQHCRQILYHLSHQRSISATPVSLITIHCLQHHFPLKHPRGWMWVPYILLSTSCSSSFTSLSSFPVCFIFFSEGLRDYIKKEPRKEKKKKKHLKQLGLCMSFLTQQSRG